MPAEMSSPNCATPPAHRVLREGEVRYNAGTTPTKYTYTGQYSNTADFGLTCATKWYVLVRSLPWGQRPLV